MADYRIMARIDPSGAISGGKRVRQELGLIDSAASDLIDGLKKGLVGFASIQVFKSLIADAKEFTSAMAEISTQVDESVFDIDDLTSTAREAAKEFASTPTGQAKAFYEIISAGAKDAASATATLTASNRLAVGGITSVATAADVLTSTLNAYGDAAGSAEDISDALFIAVRNGKTTVEEMAAGLGKATPIAAQLGVSFDQLVASVAALTSGGIKTSEAITGVRAIMASVAKPTQDAKNQAKLLGLEFNSAALRAKGFQGFLADVVEKSKGNTDALANLFGGVDALVPVLALGGEAGKAFAATMDDLGGKAGATQSAFDKMAASPGFQIDKLFANMKDEALTLGIGLLNILVPAIKAINDNFDQFAGYAKGAAIAAAAFYAVLKAQQLVAYTTALIAATAAQTGLSAAFVTGSLIGSGLAKVFTLLRLAVSPLSIIVGGLSIALIALAGDAASANKAVGDADDTLQKASTSLIETQKRAAAAGVAVDDTGTAAQSANPLVQAIATAYQTAANAAGNLAQNANAAAIAVAKKELAQLQADRHTAAGPIDDYLNGSTLQKLGSGLRQYGGELLGGPSVDQRIAAMKTYDSAIADTQKRLDLLIKAGDKDISTPKPPAPAPGGGNVPVYSSASGAGAKKAKGPTFDSIVQQLKDENEALGQNGVLQDIRAAQLGAQEKLGRELTGPENKLIDVLVREGDALKRNADYNKQLIQPMQDRVKLLGLSADEANKLSAEMQAEEILGRKLNETEKAQVDALTEQLRLLGLKRDAIDAVNGPLEDYRKKMEGLNAALAGGDISQAGYDAQKGNLGLQKDLNGLNNDLGVGGGFQQDAQLEQLRTQTAERTKIAEDAHAAGLTSEALYQEQLLAIQRDAAQQSKDIEVARKSLILNSAEETFGSLADAAKGLLGEQSAAYKALFAVSKAFAIADAIIKIQQGVAQALTLPFPANLVAAASVAAQAASIVSNIQAVSLAFANGGLVRGPGNGRSDSIPANLSDGEFVVNAAATARNRGLLEGINSGQNYAGAGRTADTMSASRATDQRMVDRADSSRGNGGGGNTNVDVPVQVVNVLDPAMILAAMKTKEGTKIVMNVIEENPNTVKGFIQ